MNCLSKLQKVLLCAGLVLIVAALFGAPKYWDYCEMQALKAEFERFVDVESWPESVEIHMGAPWKTITEEETVRVKAAIGELEFGGRYSQKSYYDSILAPTGAKDGIAFSVLNQNPKDPKAWFIYVCEDGVYCYDATHGFAIENSAELYRVLEELQVKYPD